MFDLQSAKINTAGAYVYCNGYYAFTIGIQPHDGKIPVVRLGGHCEDNETAWQCAMREVFEEANLQITALTPQITHLCDWDHIDSELQSVQWQYKAQQDPVPCLVITYRREEKTTLSLMYLAHAEGTPFPSSEIQGLLLLQEVDIHRLCRESITLKEYLASGGKAIIKDVFDTDLVLEPFAQLRLLSRILSIKANTKPPNKACTGRLGLCAFFELDLSYSSFPFHQLVLPSRR